MRNQKETEINWPGEFGKGIGWAPIRNEKKRTGERTNKGLFPRIGKLGKVPTSP